MREMVLSTRVEVYNTEDLPSAEDKALLEEAHQALRKSYSPYSQFRVAAALLLANGQIISGANQENAAYPMCLCAEQVALSAASSMYPGVAIKSMAIVVNSAKHLVDRPAAPCGACRQIICETEMRQNLPIALWLQGATGEVFHLKSGRDILPLSFDGSFL